MEKTVERKVDFLQFHFVIRKILCKFSLLCVLGQMFAGYYISLYLSYTVAIENVKVVCPVGQKYRVDRLLFTVGPM